MGIHSSLAWGIATHAHGDATVTYQAVMATLTQVLRIVQVLVVVGLFYGVFRLWWAFIKRATTLTCSHGFADPTECLDCSHPDWFEQVERYRSELLPVVEPELVEFAGQPATTTSLSELTMKQLNECLACGTMTGETSRLCSEPCLNAMYDSIKPETPKCVGCENDASHSMQGVGDTLADVCGECCDGCDERGCDFDATKKLGCGCVGYCLPEDHIPNAEGGTTAGLAKLMFG